ncbi:MAG: hypothetical protein CTY19_07540 [Methylomonas sp.]|nr:MAG: hypothetical protein CTY19_07540 [Methylomonas sp.]
MSFVVEKIPQEELARPDADQIGFNLKLSTRWAVDHDRDAFIVLNRAEGGAYEGTQITDYYTLSWNNELIHIAADPLPKTFKEQGAVMSWRVHKLTLPEALQTQKDEVLQLIRDAFGAIGEFFNGKRFISVDVEFIGI